MPGRSPTLGTILITGLVRTVKNTSLGFHLSRFTWLLMQGHRYERFLWWPNQRRFHAIQVIKPTMVSRVRTAAIK